MTWQIVKKVVNDRSDGLLQGAVSHAVINPSIVPAFPAIRLPRALLFLPARPAAMADAGGGACRAWWSRDTVAVVTGANRGIGHSLAARLAEHGLTVVLTARDGERGEAAAVPLRDRGLPVVFRRLDVSDPASVADFAAWLRDTIGGLDILVRLATTFPLSSSPRCLHLSPAQSQIFGAPPKLFPPLTWMGWIDPFLTKNILVGRIEHLTL